MATNDVTLLDSITAADASSFYGVCKVDDTHVLAVFGDGSAIAKKVQVFEVDPSDGSFTAIGTALTVDTSVYLGGSFSRIIMLDATTAVLAYATGSTSQSLQTLTINLSTYAVTNKGAEYTGMFAWGTFFNIYPISSTRLLHVGNDSASDGWVTMLAVDASSGDISSLSSAIEFEPSNCTRAALLLSDRQDYFLIMWAGVSNDGFIQGFTFDSTSMTALNSPVEYDTGEGRDPAIAAFEYDTDLWAEFAVFRQDETTNYGAVNGAYTDDGSPNNISTYTGADAFGTGSNVAVNNAAIWIESVDIFHVWTENTTDYAQVIQYEPVGDDMVGVGTPESFTPGSSGNNHQLCKLTNDLYVWSHGGLYLLDVERPGGIVPLTLSETTEVDSVARKLPSRRLSETVEATDTARARISAKVLSDSIEANDTSSRTLGRFLSDAVNVSDTFAKMKVIFLGLSDNISVTDIISRTISRMFTETVNVLDASLRTLGRTFSESVNVATSVFKVAGKVLVETLIVSDSVIRALLISFSETVEVVASKLHTLGRSFSESVLVASSMFKVIGKSLSETVSAVDAILRSLGRSLVEAVTVSDSGGVVIGKFFSESVSVTTSIIRSVGKFFSEGIVATVNIRFKINGFTAGVWAKVVRTTSAWGKAARQSSTWTKVTKITSTWRKIDRQE